MKQLIIGACLLFSSPFLATAQNTRSPDTVSNPKVFDKVEVEASFPGGANAWRDFLEKKLNPNIPVNNDAPIGKYVVIVQFIVNKEGHISDIEALTSHGYGMEQEVIKVIKAGPKWEPALQNGKPLNAYRKQPVTFVVEQENISIKSKPAYTLFVGSENPITLNIEKVENEDIGVTISQGTIAYKGGSKYTVMVTTPGKAIIEMSNLKKKGKKIAAACFEVIEKP